MRGSSGAVYTAINWAQGEPFVVVNGDDLCLYPDGRSATKEVVDIFAETGKTVEGYIAEYNGDSYNGFIVTNTYAGENLPQTGQLWWPVTILSVAGVAFILLGVVELGAGKKVNK